MQIDLASSPTLIYSLGPDLKDQRGLVNFEQKYGETTPDGDIVIRVPR